MRTVGRVTFLLAFLFPAAAALAAPPEPTQSEVRILAEEALNGRFVDIPTGSITVTNTRDLLRDMPSLCGHDPLPIGGPHVLRGALKAGLVTLQIDGKPAGAGYIGQLMVAQAMLITRHITITPTDAGRAADTTATLPAGQRLANCIRFPQGTFSVVDMKISPAHRAGGNVDPQYRIVAGHYDAQWTPTYRAMNSMQKYPDQAVVGMLVRFDPADGHWKRVKWVSRSLESEKSMTFDLPQKAYPGYVHYN